MSLIVTPPESLKGALTIPEKTLLGPGPSNVPERILKAMALPTIGHLHPEFCKVMDDCKAGVQYAFQTKVSNQICYFVTKIVLTSHCAKVQKY